jgi:ribosomal protein S18 acetylase RimI-like enzyme
MASYEAGRNARTEEGTAVTVREAEPGEHEAIHDLLASAYQEFESTVPASIYGPYIADILDLEPRARAGRLLVAEQAGRILGTVTYYQDAGAAGVGWPPGWAGVRALGVDPAARGRGIGWLLMEACVSRARQAGAPVLGLHTAEVMTAAVGLYERMGFQRVPSFDFQPGRSRRTDGEPAFTVIAYRLDL